MRLICKEDYEKRMQEVYCQPCEADKKDHYGVACRACWVDDAIASVKTMTEVDAEPVKRGAWVKDEEGCLVCSECGTPDEVNAITGEWMESNYCAQCGAKMEGAEHE